MNYSKFLLPALGAIVVGSLVRYYWPRVDTKIVTKTVIQHDIRTITRIVEHRDGTKETIIEHIDHSTEQKQRLKTVLKQADWLVSAIVLQNLRAGDRNLPSYGLMVQKRLAGPVYVGVQYIHTQIGLSIGLEF